MRGGQPKYVLAALVLAVFWGVVYWSAPASREPGVRVAGATQTDAPSQPVGPRAEPKRPAPTPERLAARKPDTTPARTDQIASLASVATAPATNEPAPPAQRSGVVAPQFREVVVQPGQTLMSIAKQVYGDSRKWETISRANPRIDPLLVKAGMKLRVPLDPKNVQGLPVDGDDGRVEAPATERQAARPTTPASATQYVVREGDTLGAIATRTLGSSRAWQALLDANKALIREPEDLRPGMTLTIPAKRD